METSNQNLRNQIIASTFDCLQQVDQEDVVLAHRYRLSLKSRPRQSSFRVLALIFYDAPAYGDDDRPGLPRLAPWIAQTTKDGRYYIVGTNDEAGYMGGAICAERAALVQLRSVPNFQVTKVVISTDSIDPITPGLLCREFLAGKPQVPWEVPVITTGCGCSKCGKENENLFPDECCDFDACVTFGSCEDHVNHSIPTLVTTIRHLYPFPSPYTRLTASQQVALGEAFCARASQRFDKLEESHSKRLLEIAILEARKTISELHPIQFGAAVIFDDGVIVTSRQANALEYGCTLDAVSRLSSHIQESGNPVLIVQADQFGIAHAPFAPARAFLTEHGFEHCQIVVHDVPVSDNDQDVFDIDKWTLKEVLAADLVPNAPTWTLGTERKPMLAAID